MLERVSRTVHNRPLIIASFAAVGALWTASQFTRIAAFTYLHFLRRSSISRYKSQAKGDTKSTKWALVTGASDGIGRGFAEELCSRGFDVVLHGRNKEKQEGVKRDLLEQWPDRQVRIFVYDATGDVAELERLAAEQLRNLRITVLINNIAAGQRPFWIPLVENTAQRVGLSVDVDARFTVEVTRILLPQLIKDSPALIINIGSLASEAPCPYASVLSGTKAFGKAWSRSLNLEMKSEGHDIEVMHILVGMVATPNENREVSLTVPTPRMMAKASLDKVGCGRDSVIGYWPHSLMAFVIADLPAWVTERMISSIARTERQAEETMVTEDYRIMAHTEDGQSDIFPWHLGVFDAHCHPTDTLDSLHLIPGMKANILTVMATRDEDQSLVAEAAKMHGVTLQDLEDAHIDWSGVHKILPAFGWHPWFSHQMYDEKKYEGALELTSEQKVSHYQSVLVPEPDDRHFILSLPDPRPFGEFVNRARDSLVAYPLALIGEVGLDKSFRIPEAWLPEQVSERDNSLTPGGREGRRLSPYRVNMDHQRSILLAQLRLAGEMQRAVSIHGVAAHGVLFETIAGTWKGHERTRPSRRERKRRQTATNAHSEASDDDDDTTNRTTIQARPYPPRICLHSYSGPAETVTQYTAPAVPCIVFFSFSVTINAWSPDGNGKVEAAVRAVPDDRILIESDLHTAGEAMDGYLRSIVEKICQIKDWKLEEGLIRLRSNWRRFALGFD